METDALQKALRYRWLIFWILALGYVLVYFHRLCPAVVAVDMMKDLGAGGTLVGLLASAYFYPYAAMQLPAGLLADSWGPRKTITGFLGLAFAGSLLLGFAPSLAWAVVGRMLVGLGVSMLFVATLKVQAEWFRAKEFAGLTGTLMAMGGLGSLTAATPLAWLSGWLGWRLAFVMVGFATLVLGALVWLFVRDRPADMGWPSPAEAAPRQGQPPALAEGVRSVVSAPAFWPLAIWFFFNCAIFFSFGGLWGGPYLMHVYGFTKSQAGQALSVFALGIILGSPLQGYLSNRVFKGRKPTIVVSSLVGLGLTGLLGFATDALPLPALYLVCLGIGMFPASIVIVGFTAAKELFPVRMAGTSVGLANLFPFAGGAAFQPFMGYLLERQGKVGSAFTALGYRHAFLALFAAALAALAASLFLRETMHRDAA